MKRDYLEELNTALEIVQTAGAIQNDNRNSFLEIEKKDDLSPVTQVDRRCEMLIRDVLLAKFPLDGFVGEETDVVMPKNGRRWIVDPLDGTRPYIRGIPTYSVLVALEDHGELVLGIIYLPAMDILCWGQKNNGAFLNGERIHVSSVSELHLAMGSGLGHIEIEEADGKNLLKLLRDIDYSYGFMDAYTYVCIASGKIDLCVNLLDKPWDCAAAACIIREAGGTFSDIHGNSSIHNGSIVFSNGQLHKSILRFFSSPIKVVGG